MASSGVQVVVRLRPLNEREKKFGTLPVISASTNDKTVTVIKGTGSRQARSSYSFDNVFTAFSTQEEVFDTTLKPVIKDVLQGYESTVFAYGQTGTGKTHTMEGSLAQVEDYGVIPRSAQALFEQLTREDLKYESFNVFCSYLEIYNEDLCDLLAEENCSSKTNSNLPPTQKLEIMEGKNGPFCRGLSEKQVESAADVLLLMQKAQHQKKVGETNMNKSSSRSHCIFTIQIHAKRRLGDGALFESKGKLHMVDLAGSECAKTAGMDEGGHEQAARERERMNINRSLLTLGRVVKLLKEQSTSKKKTNNIRIPYRDSKLTRILQQSLGGTCKTCIIATLSPSETAIEESISTLNYAQAAHGIINKPVSASFMSQATTSSAMLSGTDSSKGNSAVGTIEHWNEMECRLEYMAQQVEEAKSALARKHLQQQELVERADKAEAEKAKIEEQLQEAEKENEVLKVDLATEKKERKTVETELGKTKVQLERMAVILQATQRTEAKLTLEATALIEALQKSVVDGDQMYQTILTKREQGIARKQAANNFNSAVVALLNDVAETLASLSEQESTFCTKATEIASSNANNELQFVASTKNVVQSALECVNTAVSSLKVCMNDTSDGIIPTSDAMIKSVQANIGHVKSTIEAGEQDLTSRFSSVRETLTEFATRLSELESSHKNDAETTITVLGAHVNTSKEYVQQLVSSTSSTLEKLREDREKLFEAIKTIMEQWKSTSIQNSDAILDQATTQASSVDGVLATMTTEMQRHDNIETHLQSQISLLQSSQQQSTTQHELQKASLLETRDKLNKSHNNQNEALSTFVQNVLKGVEQLVQTQVAEIINQSNNSHHSILESSNTLIENQTNIAKSTLETLRSAETLSSNIQEQAQVVKQNDANAIANLDKTKAVFAEVQNIANAQKTSTETYASNAFESVKELKDMEADDVKVIETLATEGQQYMDHLSGQMLDNTCEQIKVLKASGESITNFTRETVLPSISSAVDDMETPRETTMTNFLQHLTNLEESVMESSESIKQKAGQASKAADNLESGVSSVESDFLNKTVETRNSEIEAEKDNLVKAAKDHTEGVSNAITTTQGETNKAVTAVQHFVTEELSANKEVEAAPERTPIVFVEILSSTPSEEELLKSMKLSDTDTVTSTESEDNSENQSQTSSWPSPESVDSTIGAAKSSNEGGKSGSVLQSISPNDENSAAKKRSRKSISSTPVKQKSPVRNVPQRRPSKLALPKVTSSSSVSKRARR